MKWHRDVDDNCIALVIFLQLDAKIAFSSEIIIEHYEESPLDFIIEPSAVSFPFHYDATEEMA